jgi:methionyl-tRNA formyltransferase
MINILFMGRKKVAALCLEHLISLKQCKVVGVLTDSHLATSSTGDVARRAGLPIMTIEEAQSCYLSGKLRFDLGVSMLYWRKIKGDLLSAAPRGIINFHPAPLPAYKGTAGYNLAILEGLSEWATTAHYIDESIDTGAIIDVSRFQISSRSETAQTLERKSQEALFSQFSRVISRALASPMLLETSPNGPGRYVTRAEMEAMKRIKPGDDLEIKTRAFWFPPYDGAYVEIDGKRYTLVSQEMLRQLAEPGTSSLFSPPQVNHDSGS